MTISLEPVDVTDLLSEVITLMRPLAAARSIVIGADEAACERHVLADRQRFKQVLLNLMANAVKYNRAGGSITVACRSIEEDRLQIRVSDTGYGISPEQQARLFTPFERLGAQATGVEGTGMGLALSKGLVEAMGGSIEIESDVDVGTTFSVELGLVEGPLAAYERTRPLVSMDAPPLEGGARRRILHIEDNTSNLRLVERILAQLGDYELVTATQGRLGLALAREHRPDLILLDLHLPDVPGREILRDLRRDPATRTIPIVIISADATKTQMDRLAQDGASGYLTKPLDIAAFVELLATTFDDTHV